MARVSPQATAFAHRESEALVMLVAFAREQAHHLRRAGAARTIE